MVTSCTMSVEEFDKVINKNKISIFDFSATWCGPCRMMSPVVEDCSEKYSDYSFYKIDVDECEQLSMKLGIRYVPTFIIYSNGKELGRTSGYLPLEEFEEFLNQAQKNTDK